MNAKAEVFKKFLDDNNIKDFAIEEPEGNELHAVIFRSTLDINGTQIPTIFILDDSIYGMIRVFVAPNAQNSKDIDQLQQLLNEYNLTYKAFKFFTDNDGNVIMDTCFIISDEKSVNGDLVYDIYRTIVDQLKGSYPDIMKVIWG